MKAIFILFFLSTQGYASCPMIECFNPCTQEKVSLEGDKCSVTWNKSLQCFEAYAECGDSKKCLGALCYDECSGKNHYYPKANSCEKVFDSHHMCWAATAHCE